MAVGTRPMTFQEVKRMVAKEDISKMYRSPQCMAEYNEFKKDFKSRGIDMTTNLLVNQLFWLPKDIPLSTPASVTIPMVKYSDARLFADPTDQTITTNAFPYNLEAGIPHLCVWVKSPLPPDPASEKGDISPQNKKLVDKYIKQTFTTQLGIREDQIVWFKNWTALQSVKAIPHIHVILDHPDEEKVKKMLLTGGVPLNYEEAPKL